MTAGQPGDEPPLSPRDSLALIERQGQRARRRLMVRPSRVFLLWGVTYLIGWGSCYLAAAPHALLPFWVAGVLTGALHLVAIGYPVVRYVRAGRGVEGPSRTTGAMYGASWALGFVALAAINSGLARYGLAPAVESVLWSAGALLVVGLLYLAGGMLWRDRVHYALGVWMLATGAGCVFAGVPGNFLVLALAGGGGFLLQGGFAALRERR